MRAWILVAMAPLCGAWQGAGQGAVEWAAGREKVVSASAVVPAEVVMRHEWDEGLSVVVTLELPGADGLLTFRVEPPPPAGTRIELPDPRVRVGYTEYGAEGEARFSEPEVAGGSFEMPAIGGRSFDLRFELDLRSGPLPEGDDRTVAEGAVDEVTTWRRLKDLELRVVPVTPVVPRSTPSTGGGVEVDPVADTGGCHGHHHDTYAYSGDDWETEDTGSDSSDSSGCEGDDLGSESSSDSGGCAGDGGSSSSSSGCGGDDLGGSSSSGCGGGGDVDSCRVAPSGRPVLGRPWLRRLVSWVPWIGAFAALRLMRRRPRRA